MANVNFFSPDGGTTRYPIEDTEARSGIAGQQSLLKDTVGWTGKNLLKNTTTTRTINGVTFTVNDDGSVTVNGTATANIIDYFINKFTNDYFPYDTSKEYILSGCPDGGSSNGYRLDIVGESGIVFGVDDIGNGAIFQFPKVPTGTERFSARIRIGNGTVCNNVVFKPMIRKADITDPTYEPYHESVEEEIEQVYVGNGVLGAKNLILFPYHDKTKTTNGITFTVNNDGTVTANGTASANSYFECVWWTGVDSFPYKNTELILTGCPSGGSESTYRVDIGEAYNSSSWLKDHGEGVTIPYNYFNNNTNMIQIRIVIFSGQTVSNLIFKPMIRLASSDPDDTYQPYAMTNRELTEYNKGFNFLKLLFNADGSDIYSGNLNDLHAGYAYYSSAAANVPSDNYGYCITLERPSTYNYAVQIAITSTGDSANMYVRKKSSNTWGAWRTVAMS